MNMFDHARCMFEVAHVFLCVMQIMRVKCEDNLDAPSDLNFTSAAPFLLQLACCVCLCATMFVNVSMNAVCCMHSCWFQLLNLCDCVRLISGSLSQPFQTSSFIYVECVK